MSAVLFLATFVIIWVSTVANESRERIVMGVHQGVPISIKHRWMIFNDWVAFKFMPALVLLIVSLAFLYVGQSVGDPKVGLISFLCGGTFAGAALFIVVLGISDMLFILSALRKDKRN
jgi:predicted small integral membrane protein